MIFLQPIFSIRLLLSSVSVDCCRVRALTPLNSRYYW